MQYNAITRYTFCTWLPGSSWQLIFKIATECLYGAMKGETTIFQQLILFLQLVMNCSFFSQEAIEVKATSEEAF